MTNERVSPTSRIRAANVAEKEIMRYAGDHAAWHKHVHNVDLDPVQLLKMEQMDKQQQSIDFSCRRTGKTATKELWNLEYLACNADQELGIVAPREAQAQVNLRYHLEAIRRSPLLSAFLFYDRGREQFSDTRFQLANRSRAQSYGIMAQVDGGDLTLASLEEVDDMPRDRLYARFLLMMGSTRRLGASKTSVNKPIIRITGVFKGADTLADMIASGSYFQLKTVDVYLAMAMGIVNEQFMLQMRDELPPAEYLRQLLCVNVTSRNLIWEKWVRQAVTMAIRVGITIVQPEPGIRYRKRGLLAFGYDHLGHGEDPSSSRSALVVIEEVMGFRIPIFAKQWKAGENEAVIKGDLKSFWRYFGPDYAMGDAYGIGMIESLNDELFAENLTPIDRRTVGEGDNQGSSTATTWKGWAFQPIRFEGMVKHQMAQATAMDFKGGHAAIPYIDDLGDQDPAVLDMRELQRQLPNIAAEPTSKPYSSYRRVNNKIGDDLFDAYIAGTHALNTRGTGDVKGLITLRQQSEADLLAQHVEIAA